MSFDLKVYFFQAEEEMNHILFLWFSQEMAN